MIECELARLPRPVAGDASGTSPTGLLASFADLVEQLALGPEPEVRECPVCKHTRHAGGHGLRLLLDEARAVRHRRRRRRVTC
jgi:hypothetical protein